MKFRLPTKKDVLTAGAVFTAGAMPFNLSALDTYNKGKLEKGLNNTTQSMYSDYFTGNVLNQVTTQLEGGLEGGNGNPPTAAEMRVVDKLIDGDLSPGWECKRSSDGTRYEFSITSTKGEHKGETRTVVINQTGAGKFVIESGDATTWEVIKTMNAKATKVDKKPVATKLTLEEELAGKTELEQKAIALTEKYNKLKDKYEDAELAVIMLKPQMQSLESKIFNADKTLNSKIRGVRGKRTALATAVTEARVALHKVKNDQKNASKKNKSKYTSLINAGQIKLDNAVAAKDAFNDNFENNKEYITALAKKETGDMEEKLQRLKDKSRSAKTKVATIGESLSTKKDTVNFARTKAGYELVD